MNMQSLTDFIPLNADQLGKTFISMNKKFYEFDPIPIMILKECFSDLCPLILNIVNTALANGEFPNAFKHDTVTPIIKNNDLDVEELKIYWPISKTPAISKLLEKTAEEQIKRHLTQNNLESNYQSAYRKNHSCETAIFKIVNDIQEEIFNNRLALLVMLDLSAAFDTIDHDILIDILRNRFKIRNTALKFIESYLRNRTFSVCVGNASSEKMSLRYGVPQGSILGPLLFTMYINGLDHVAVSCANNMIPHIFADDSNLYIGFEP